MLPICISTFAFYSASISSFIPFRSVVNAVSNWQSFFFHTTDLSGVSCFFPLPFVQSNRKGFRYRAKGGEVFFMRVLALQSHDSKNVLVFFYMSAIYQTTISNKSF